MLLKNYHFIFLLFIFSIFLFIFLFSTKNIINLWTFNESHINYSDGFVSRGLFGTIMIFLNNTLKIKNEIFFSSYFFLFSILNLILFYNITKKFSYNFIIFTFIFLNPSLILFSFYDLGGYARFEINAIFCILLHTWILNKYYEREITINEYEKFLTFALIPFIFIFIFINEIIIFTIPFHFFLSLNAIKLNKERKIFIFKYFILLAPSLIVISNPLNLDMAKNIYKNIGNNNLDFWIFESISTTLKQRLQIEAGYMFTFKNFFKYFFIFLIFFLPINYLFLKLEKKNIIKIFNINYLVLSLLPLIPLFFIARDWGRWMHLIMIITTCYYLQFSIIKKTNNTILNKKLLKKIFFIFFLFIYLFSFRIPHCCNIDYLKISVFGGAVNKIIVFYNLIFTNKINVKQRFKSIK